VACRHIVAHPGTLTGSIGVLWVKLAAGDLFARLGVHRQHLARGRHAAMHDVGKRYNKTQLALVEKGVQRIDQVFRERVAAGRGLAPGQVDPVAEGRLFTGAQARDAGLVDHLGDVTAAVERAREMAALPPSAPVREVGGASRRLLAPRAEGMPLWAYAAEGVRLLGTEGAYTLCPWSPEGGDG